MKIDLDTLRAMAAAGATADMIITVIERELAFVKRKRAQDADRQRRHRIAKHIKSRDVTLQSRDVTLQSRDSMTEDQDLVATPNTEPQSPVVIRLVPRGQSHDKKEKSPTPPKEKITKRAGARVRVRARSKERATRLPEDWQPDLDDLAFAKTLLREDLVSIEIAKFRDYWHARAGPRALSVRWSATWRNWCRKTIDDQRPRPTTNNGGANGTAKPSSNHSRPTSWQESRDKWRVTIAKLHDSIAADKANEATSGENVRSAATAGHDRS